MREPKFNEHKFEELSIDEQRNEILKAIHNRLGEIAALLPYIAKAIAPSYRFNVDEEIRNMLYDRDYIKHSSKIYDYEEYDQQKGEPN